MSAESHNCYIISDNLIFLPAPFYTSKNEQNEKNTHTFEIKTSKVNPCSDGGEMSRAVGLVFRKEECCLYKI